MNSIEQINSENGMASQWGLLREISPSFGARLVQERYRLHFLSDRAGFIGEWTDHQKAKLEAVFPEIVKELEGGFICEADTLGSFGYVYINISSQY
ncbi:type IV toxin-antitoxin system YeeU family antitoxin [Aeromonas salmonicida]|uniref:type IV toxin-antitoxin system YeeU family antitoxin n=1 Tax=Aeromonas salmonicida TaxID=645 RepID=UPI000C885142|nr:type IV toxin-antitoxin system YeeU family antitoxin [Aeromonas salmonicida]PMU04046.1 hypothetical protein CJI17_16230 [Aeromonas salmonicida]